MDSKPATADARPCFGARLCAELQRMILVAVIAGLVAIAAKYYGYDRLNEEIRSRFEAQLRENYRGLRVSVRSARRVAGRGVEIRGIRIAEAGNSKSSPIADIDEIFAECDTRLPDFLTRPPQITAVRVHRLKLRAERTATGRWTVASLLPLPNCQSSCAPVATITDSTLELIDPSHSPSSTSGLVLRNIELAVSPETGPGNPSQLTLRVRGTLAGDHLERVEVDGRLNPTTCAWDIRGSVEGLEFSPRLRAALPREISESLAPLSSVRGRTVFGFQLARGPRQNAAAEPAPLQFAIQGKISEGRIDDARLPEPLTDVEAKIRCDNAGVRVDDLSARCGVAQIQMPRALFGYTARQPAELELAMHAVPLEQLPRKALPQAVGEAFDQFQPRGLADISGRLHFDGTRWRPELKIDCHDLSVSYFRFPYRVTDGSGWMTLADDVLKTDIRLLGGGSFIQCRCELHNPGPNYSGWIALQSDDAVTIDDKLLNATDAATQRVLKSFQPRGNAAFAVRFERAAAGAPLHRRLEIDLRDCSIQHDHFAYPIDRISGVLAGIDENWEFRQLAGRNDSAEIACEGFWKDFAGGDRRLLLRFNAVNVPLADELRLALPLSSQTLWSNLRPRGTVDRVSVDLGYTTATKHWSIEVAAQKECAATSASSDAPSMSLEPAWMRYPLHQVGGSLHYRDGTIELSNLRAVHGRASFTGGGKCSILPDGGYRLDLNKLTADGIEVDQDLIAALPGGAGQTLARFPLHGDLSARGNVTITAPPHATTRPHVAWDAELDIENGRLMTATPIEHIYGGLSLRGQHGTEGLFARGELNIDSAMVRDIQLARMQGPYWFDGRQLTFGAFADRDNQRGAPRQVTARVVGGLLSLDGMIFVGGETNFDMQVTLANADLTDVAHQLAPHQTAPTGRVFAVAHILGTGQGKHTWHGDGKISLREADLYELPAMLTLLKLLSIQRPNSTAFTNSNIDFRIEGDDLVIDRIDFSGDAISLKGKGRINGQRQVDLKFYPLVGREERQLPIFRPLLGQTGQEVMLIEVTGTIDQPDIRRTPFPRIDARLQQLFPELARNETNEPKTPAAPGPREALNRFSPRGWR
jgi:hypothetical protein